MTAPTLADVRAWLRKCAEESDEIAHGYANTDDKESMRWHYHAARARLALSALDDAERLDGLRRNFVASAEILHDTVNTVRAHVTVARYLPADVATSEVLAREFDLMCDAARQEGA